MELADDRVLLSLRDGMNSAGLHTMGSTEA